MSNFSMWVAQYAQVKEFPVSGLLYGRHNEGCRVAPYCYALLRDDQHAVVIDTGFDNVRYNQQLAAQYGVTHWQSPDVVLGRLGVPPEDVDAVILTHNHFDHAGNIDAFPNARVFLQHQEVTKFLKAKALPEQFEFLTFAVDPDLMISLVERLKRRLLTLTEDRDCEVYPGLTIKPALNTHTPGSQYVVVENDADGRWIFPGDNVYVYENLEGNDGDGRYVPIGLIGGSVERCIFLMDEIYHQVDRQARRVLPFHEERLWDVFPSRTFDDGLHVAEISLAGGHGSVLPSP